MQVLLPVIVAAWGHLQVRCQQARSPTVSHTHHQKYDWSRLRFEAHEVIGRSDAKRHCSLKITAIHEPRMGAHDVRKIGESHADVNILASYKPRLRVMLVK